MIARKGKCSRKLAFLTVLSVTHMDQPMLAVWFRPVSVREALRKVLRIMVVP